MLNDPTKATPAGAAQAAKSLAESGRVTPMMAQYIEIKAANPDCLLFYRMGDFYEMFFEDAEIASRALGIVLTKRGKHQGEDIPMCGVPVERADDYLQRLIGLGHRVAVCEQVEDPSEARKRGAKSLVARDVVRLVTPGTITEERLLDPTRANLLVAIARVRLADGQWVYGLAAADISTGAFSLAETAESGLAAEIARLEPREIVAAEALCEEPRLARLVEDQRIPLTPMPRDIGEPGAAERRLRDFFGVATLDGLGAFSRPQIAAAATAIAYIERTQIGARPPLSLPTRADRGTVLEIDAATRANLELTRTLAGAREGSLVHTIDLTVTPAGGRLLVERLASPLTDPAAILRRLDAVEFLLGEPALRADVRAPAEGGARSRPRPLAHCARTRRTARPRQPARWSRRGGRGRGEIRRRPAARRRNGRCRRRCRRLSRPSSKRRCGRRSPTTCRSPSATAASCAPATPEPSTRRGRCATRAAASSPRCRRAIAN